MGSKYISGYTKNILFDLQRKYLDTSSILKIAFLTQKKTKMATNIQLTKSLNKIKIKPLPTAQIFCCAQNRTFRDANVYEVKWK